MRKLQNDELHRVSVEEFKVKKKNPYVLLLDNVRSLHNVGAAFRTADAFLAGKIYLCGITGTPPNREITKTALGATQSVAWEYVPEAGMAIKTLQAEGYRIIAVEQVEKSTSLFDFQVDANQKYCFIFGNEVAGIQEAVLTYADLCLEIPQFGTKHSLNIAVSMGVVLWDYLTKIKNIT